MGVGPRRQPRHHRRHRPHDRAWHVADPVSRPDRDARRHRQSRPSAVAHGSCRWRCRAGMTTLITAGFEEPVSRMHRTLEAFEHLPVNVGLQASARTDSRAPIEALIEGGLGGAEDPRGLGRVSARSWTRPWRRRTSTTSRSACIPMGSTNRPSSKGTIAAIAGRTIHAYHVEGTGGGHIPDLLGLVREPNVLCSSTTPSLPWGPSAAAEALDMIMIVHEQNPAVAEDVAAARERIREPSMAAEGPLHELGAISIVNSDSQGMGRIGETIRRTWQLADAMKRWRASELGAGRPEAPAAAPAAPAPGSPSNPRRQRTGAALPREVHAGARAGARHRATRSGSLAPGHAADLVLWEPAMFGVRPVMVDQGRRRRVERDGRGQRQRPRRPTHALRPGLGRHRRSPRRGCRRRSSREAALRRGDRRELWAPAARSRR